MSHHYNSAVSSLLFVRRLNKSDCERTMKLGENIAFPQTVADLNVDEGVVE